jgi:hypothetical protein
MKVNDYLCPSCGQVNECFVGDNEDESKLTCLNCGASGLEKQLAAVNIGGRFNSQSPKMPGHYPMEITSCDDDSCPVTVERIPATLHLPEGDRTADVIRVTRRDYQNKDEKIQ